MTRYPTLEDAILAKVTGLFHAPRLALPRIPAVPRITLKRVGGITFLRVGRLQFSWCVCQRPAQTRRFERSYQAELNRLLRL